MRTVLLFGFLALQTACSVDVQFGKPGRLIAAVPERDGPAFAEAFPDPTVLISTKNITATRIQLARTPLPQTKEHQLMIRGLLDNSEPIDSQHLRLLSEAIYLPHRDPNAKKSASLSFATVQGQTFVHSREFSPFSHFVDEILVAGSRKLSDTTPAALGRLLGATMTEQAVIELSNLLLEKCDDESNTSLKEILAEIPFSTVRLELCTQVLAPRDRLQGGRTDIALDSMSFDSNRTKLATSIYARLKTLDPAAMIRHVGKQSFDEGRLDLARLGAPLLSSLEIQQAVALVKLASFDKGRLELLAVVRDKLKITEAGESAKLVALASFDKGRTQTLRSLTEGTFPGASEADLLKIAKLSSFDAGRQTLLDALQPKFDGTFSRAGAEALLKLFAFDAARLQFLESYQEALRELPDQDRMSLAARMTFDKARSQARQLLANPERSRALAPKK